MINQVDLLAGIISILIFLGVGIFTFALFVWELKKMIVAKTWPITEGKIISSDVKRDEDGDGYSIYAIINFSYNVNGIDYRSNTYRSPTSLSGGIWSILPGMERRYANKVVKKYPVNRPVDVFYNPDNPANAVLETGFSSSVLIWLCFAIPFGLTGLFGLISLLLEVLFWLISLV
ncbi:MAG: DUF3592 domain-containing protein [Candidatus Hodarchaeales archaeon]